MRYLSLFSGIGGMEKGIEQSYGKSVSTAANAATRQNNIVGYMPDTSFGGGRRSTPVCCGFSEIDKNAVAIYRYHYPDHRNFGDATGIVCSDLPDFDLLVGGFPCQAFSIAGKRKGFLDTRGTLFFEIARILEAKRPQHFLLENVKGLFSHDEGRTFKTIVAALIDIGYCVEWDCLNSKFYGVPQNRERVFVVGHLGRIPGREVFPIEESNDGHFAAIPGERPLRGRNKSISGCLKTRGVNQFDRSDLDKLIFTDMVQPKIYDWNGARNDGGMSLREHSDGIVRALKQSQSGTSTPMTEIENRIRRLTPRECEALQGFPLNWTQYGRDESGKTVQMSDSARYKACGNAVSVPVIEAIINRMRNCCD